MGIYCPREVECADRRRSLRSANSTPQVQYIPIFSYIGDNDQFVPFVKADCFDNESKCKQFVLEQSNQADRNGSVDYARCNRVG